MTKTAQELITTMAAGQEARTDAEPLMMEIAKHLQAAGDVAIADGVLNDDGRGGFHLDVYDLPPQIRMVYENAWATGVLLIIIPKRKQEG